MKVLRFLSADDKNYPNVVEKYQVCQASFRELDRYTADSLSN